jgi:hypothetical protein
MQILLGADPEVFVKDTRGRFRSAHGLIPGTKKEPYPVDDGAVQVDGMALEFNIKPAATEDEWVHNLSSVMAQLGKMVAPKYTLEIVPTARFHGNHMRAQPEEALELGCEPDYDAYTERQNGRPDGNTYMRTAAGHIHIGFTEGADPKDPAHMIRCITLVKQLDAYLGIPSLEWDKDTLRRRLYGKAGAFRPKPYGVEYRTLSNAWLKNEMLVRYVYRQTMRAIEDLMAGKKLSDDSYKRIASKINYGWGWYAAEAADLVKNFPAVPKI